MQQARENAAASSPATQVDEDEIDAALGAAEETSSEAAFSAENVLEEPASQTVIEMPKAVSAPSGAKLTPVNVVASDIVSAPSSLYLHEALTKAVGANSGAVFKIAALQSGYTAEIGALAFEDIARLQSSSVDAHAARMKLLRTLFGMIREFSCGQMKFADWLKQTAQGDYDTLMYGLYAATYPGDNDFDVRCRHCGHENKIRADVNTLVRAESDDVYSQIRTLLDPRTDFRGAIAGSLVGRTVQYKLPNSGIVAEIRNPSIQDYLDGVQWFVTSQDKNTGALPQELAGAETIRTLTMYVTRLLVPVPNTSQFFPVTSQQDRSNLIGRLSRADGNSLVEAVDSDTKKLEVSYKLPDYNCAACGKRNEDLVLDFETLLFIKLREKE
jgi:hypothetical protein